VHLGVLLTALDPDQRARVVERAMWSQVGIGAASQEQICLEAVTASISSVPAALNTPVILGREQASLEG
jgi:hypothetical protein